MAKTEERPAHFCQCPFYSPPGVSVHPRAATVSSQEEGFVLLSLPRSAADPKKVHPEKALPRSYRLGRGAHHWHGRYGMQGLGFLFVSRLKGCDSTIPGLDCVSFHSFSFFLAEKGQIGESVKLLKGSYKI